MLLTIKKIWKKGLILIAIGIAISIYMATGAVDMMAGNLVSNAFFVIANVFFIVALAELVDNLGVFNGFKYGLKCLRKIIRGEKESSGAIKEGYLEYVNSRTKKTDVSALFIIAAVFFVISVIAALIK